MQKLSGVYYNSGKQNKDISKASQDCEWKVVFCLRDRNPFCSEAGGLQNREKHQLSYTMYFWMLLLYFATVKTT